MASLCLLVSTELCSRGGETSLSLGIRADSHGGLRLDWPNALPSDGFAVVVASNLEAGAWALVGDPDQWPSAGSNVLVQAEWEDAVYRLESSGRGELVDVAFQQTVSPILISFLLAQYGLTGITPTYSVSIYRVTYETFDHRRGQTLASGALCIPEGLVSAPVISLQHGTVYERVDAPSSFGAVEQALGVAIATEGYIAILPDYLGLGTNSPPLHPYVHARSEAVASVDMLRACTTYIAGNLSVVPNGRLFLAGYSQGGHSTLALLRELEANHAATFPVTACAPMAGPHDLSGVMRDRMLANVDYDTPSYLPYALLGMNSIYGLFDSPSDFLAPPYDSTIPPMFDGATSGGDINAALPSIPRHMLETNFLASFESDTNNAFLAALRANDTWRGWLPVTPLRFYHCSADEIVPVACSQIAVSNLLAAGASDVTFVDPLPAAGHEDCALPAFLAAKAWFDTLKSP